MRRTYCPNDCDYRSYYLSQVGSGLSDIKIFRGFPYQRGYGIGAMFKRFGIPLLQFLGKHLLSTGMSIGTDILANRNIKDSLKQRVKEGSKTAAEEGLNKLSTLIDQTGTGTRRVYKKRVSKKKLSRKRDIFG